MGLSARRDGLAYVPRSYSPERPAPLAVMMHGAGGDARQAIDLFRVQAEEAGVLLVAPTSWSSSWDVIASGFGPDVERLDLALARAFADFVVDLDHVAVGGFSDGASYALSIGITNGDVFGAVLAFSPGFVAPGEPRGRPRLFVSHGLRDNVLPIDATSRRVVPQLRAAGYAVDYREFDGPHTVPAPVARDGFAWFLGEGAG